VNQQSLDQANALLAVAAEGTSNGEVIARPLADIAREVGLPTPLSLARAVRALVSRGRIASDQGEYRLLDNRPLESGERVSVAPRPGRRARGGGRRSEARAAPDGGVPTYADLGRALVERLIEMARETAAVSELADVRRELREERSARVRAEERATELHARVRDLEAKLDMAEENIRRVIGVVRQGTPSAAKPSDPETQALLAILRGNGGASSGDPEDATETAETR
jgi:hypothetical protein